MVVSRSLANRSRSPWHDLSRLCSRCRPLLSSLDSPHIPIASLSVPFVRHSCPPASVMCILVHVTRGSRPLPRDLLHTVILSLLRAPSDQPLHASFSRTASLLPESHGAPFLPHLVTRAISSAEFPSRTSSLVYGNSDSLVYLVRHCSLFACPFIFGHLALILQ